MLEIPCPFHCPCAKPPFYFDDAQIYGESEVYILALMMMLKSMVKVRFAYLPSKIHTWRLPIPASLFDLSVALIETNICRHVAALESSP